MRALVLSVLLFSLPVFAAPTDAPVKIELEAGQPAPVKGCFLDEKSCVATGQEIKGLRAENESLKQSIRDFPSPVVWMATGLVLGVSLSYGVYRLLPR